MLNVRSFLAAGALAAMLSALPAQAAIFTPGPQDAPSPPGHNFPRWYTDSTGMSLEPCLSNTTDLLGLPMCILLAEGGFNPANPIVFLDNFPPENFYYIADSLIDVGIAAEYRAALEGAFGTNPPEPGQQISFVRVRIRVTPSVDGHYRVTHPFGQRVFQNVVASDGRFTFVDDRGLGQPGGPFIPFNSPEGPLGNVQRFLVRAAGPITIGNEVFIGDPNVAEPVTGATFLVNGAPFNAFRVEIDTDKDGNYDQTFESNTFAVAGKMIGMTIAPQAGTDFPPAKIGVASAAKTFTLTNISNGILNLNLDSFVSSNPEFAVAETDCAAVPSGASCTFNAVFTPSGNGPFSTTLTISGGASVPPAQIALTGTGDSIPPTVDITAPVGNSFTTDTTPLIAYTVSDGTVVVLVDDVIVPKVSGDSLAALGDGSHTLRVESTDTAGNVGFAVSTFTVDTIPPTATISGTPANPTNLTTASLTIAGDQVESYQVKHNNGAVGSFVPVAQTLQLSSLVQGTHTISIFGRDAAGNVQVTPTVVSWVVDTTPPALVITNDTLLTKVNTLTLQGTVESGIVPVVTVAAPATAGAVTESNGTWSCIISNLKEGQNNVTVTATDAATNVSTRTPIITLDTIPPTYEIGGKPADPTKQTSVTLVVSGAEVATYDYKLDNGSAKTNIAAGTPISENGLADGLHTVTVVARDLAGNEGTPVSVSWTVDTTPPALTLANHPVSTSNTTMPISGTVEAGATLVVTTNAGTPVQVQPNGGTWSFNLSNLVVGLNTITITATDAAGNSASTSATIAAGSYAVTATAGTGGSISPSGMSAYVLGSAKTFIFTPDPHYHVSDVVVDGISKGARTSIRLANINNDHTISVVFALDTYAIKATANAGGTVTPTVAGKVEHGADKTFDITPKPGFHIVDVLVDGASVGAVSTYKFQNVSGPGHKISAKFSNLWTISLRKTGKGTVLGGVIAKVREGLSKTYTIKPAAGYQISDITLDGVSVKNSLVNNKLIITDVTANHDLNVTFTPVL